jgi:hypothetical protein
MRPAALDYGSLKLSPKGSHRLNLKAALAVVALLILTGCSAQFSDSYGGNGNGWVFPKSCPTPKQIETLVGTAPLVTPAAEAHGSPFNNGCHYTNVAAGQVVEIFEDANSYAFAKPPSAESVVIMAPSLGKGAELVTGRSTTLCDAEVPNAGGGKFKSIIVSLGIDGKQAKDVCADAVKVLHGFVSQAQG